LFSQNGGDKNVPKLKYVILKCRLIDTEQIIFGRSVSFTLKMKILI